MVSLNLNVLSFGASRNIGYFSAVRLLERGATVTFLLRSPDIFDKDALIQSYVKSGHARLLKGDALNEADTRLAWNEAGVVDLLLFSIGGRPSASSFSISEGFVLKPHNLVTQCIFNVLCTMPTYSDASQPRIITISSTGLTTTAHAALPLMLKPLYAMIKGPHQDKLGMERVLAYCAGWAWNSDADGEPTTDVMGTQWTERKGLPGPGTLKRVLVIRPALLTDGKCVADKVQSTGKGKMYRVSEDELGGYTVSRKDVAHFIVDALGRWEEFGNKHVNIAY
ncbi:hypothetical protein B0H11DRAFT_2006306 [Mycena galericulata]|nr:hypothetical protein B0H11DRAFT_2006306 [Mycena galericulata]